MKIDLHCHTYYSHDAISSPEQLIKQALKCGLDGIAITDHETTAGWEEAIKAGERLNAKIILGQEIKTNRGDILALFITKQINGKNKDPKWVINEIKKQRGLAIIPHPYHFPESFKENLDQYIDLVDGIEVFNSRLPFPWPDKKAFDFAKKNNLIMTSGSDAHYYRGVGKAYTECEANSLEEFKIALENKKSLPKGRKSSIFYLIFSTLKRLKLIRANPNS